MFFNKDKKSRIKLMNIKIDKHQCHCDACRLDYPVEDKCPINDQAAFSEIMMHSENAGDAAAVFPVSMTQQLDNFTSTYQLMAEDFPSRETAQYEKLIHQVMLATCKFLTVWPLLRREFYQNSERFLSSGIYPRVPYVTLIKLKNPHRH